MTEVGFLDHEALDGVVADDAVVMANTNSELIRAKSRCHSRPPSLLGRPHVGF